MIERRTFLAGSAAAAGTLGAGGALAQAATAAPTTRSTTAGSSTGADATPVFRHGVASGDPLPDAVVLWTRVTPTSDALPGSGAGPRVAVGWQVATDPEFRRVVAQGSTATGPERDHTVKVDARGLAPATDHWYRFTLDGATSPVGRTRTAPAPTATPERLRLALVSCSNWEAGYFSAYRHLAARGDLDAVLHMGDYLYEYGTGEYANGQSNRVVRAHEPAHEMVSLADYRQRHAQYKTDPDLQALHAAVPWVTTWDDHESANDAWSGGAENHQPDEGDWATRKAVARTAYDEWMPVRLSGTAVAGDGVQVYRHLQFGRLADLTMLDLRSYRSQQAATTDPGSTGDPSRTITGDAQMQFLKDRLAEGDATWKLVGNPVMVSPVLFPPLDQHVAGPIADLTGILPRDGAPYNVDQWDGYTADRRELVDFLADRGIANTLFLTGDIHSAWACELPVDPGTYPLSRTVGVELVATSVTSNNLDDLTGSPPRTSSLAVEDAIRASNRHVKHLDFDSHGYSVLTITPQETQMDWYVTSDRADQAATSTWSTGWKVAVGSNKLTAATGEAR
ncbi:alkaline phosphatase D family protein [Knoellia sp. 3-2P3]|uniref:alkaline phosphatase D family protein n=1 Tax=unclassified Knoellia TaxID=2618719 RepID=UPI0023DAEB8B|nr:alkaline phosphatase D family protein [Knoellia sp. 3-2P3]MDF2092768.1 alkaline phosphatase D family protein [Knoellia sp. 3-2P3]